MIVHLHTVCWNDRRMLDFFLRHYEPWIDHFFLFDDGSTDGTREYLDLHPRVSVERTQRSDPDSWVSSAQHIYNTAWERSRGQADWVVVTNIDELLFHPEMRNYLSRCGELGITAIPALGYQMLSADFPPADAVLTRDVRRGMPWAHMNRIGIFDPDRIEATNFTPGRHRAGFTGDARLPEREEVLNLHYKYLGHEYTSGRHAELAGGLRKRDRELGWGHKYSWDDATLRADFAAVLAGCVDVFDPATDHAALHAEGRWWR